MSGQTLTLSMIFKAVDRVSKPIGKIGTAVKKLHRESGLNRVSKDAVLAGKSIGNLAGEVGRFGTKLALLSGGAAFLFKRQLIDTAVAFENYGAVLQTIEGDSIKAKEAFKWIREFTAKTPFQLEQVTEAYVALRSYGLNPTNGLLQTLGDTAAAMNRPIMQAAEAIADAMTGENERLKELGIVARVSGKKVAYEYAINGKQMRKVAQKNNRAQIEETITAIWNEKYGGAMDKMSKTFAGMISNIQDQWTEFKMMMMDAGAFDFLKDKLSGLLTTINRMAASGELQRLAKDMGERLVTGLQRLWQAGQAVVTVLGIVGGALSGAADLLGGWENLGIVLVSLWGVKVVAAFGSALMAIGTLSMSLMATPVGWFLLAVAAIAAAAFLIWKNWDWVAGKLDDIWGGMKTAVQLLKVMFLSVASVIADAISGIVNLIPDFIRTKLHLDGVGKYAADINRLRNEAGLDLQAMGSGAQAVRPAGNPAHGGSVNRSQVDVSLKIDSEGRPQVRDIKTSGKNVNLDVDAGLVMVGG